MGKKVAWKSSTSFGIVVNLFNYFKTYTRTQKNKIEKHIEEVNKSCVREEKKKSPYCELDDITSQKTIASHTQELKSDEKKEQIGRNYSTIEFHSKLFLKLSLKLSKDDYMKHSKNPPYTYQCFLGGTKFHQILT